MMQGGAAIVLIIYKLITNMFIIYMELYGLPTTKNVVLKKKKKM